MSSLELSDYERMFLGTYLIVHGLIHLVFLIYKYDKNSESYVGWSGKSWFLSKIDNQQITKSIGKLTWSLIVILFVLSGLAVFKLIETEYTISLIVGSSVIATAAFMVFYDGLVPTPLHWILGVAVNVVLIVFVVFWKSNALFAFVLLILIWLYGMFIHTKIIPQAKSTDMSNI